MAVLLQNVVFVLQKILIAHFPDDTCWDAHGKYPAGKVAELVANSDA